MEESAASLNLISLIAQTPPPPCISTSLLDQREKCPPGQKSDTGLAPCSKCAIGTYQPESSATSCRSCPRGQTTDSEGSTSLLQCRDAKIPCKEGTFSPSGLQPCVACSAGTYQSYRGQKVCKPCRADTYQVGNVHRKGLNLKFYRASLTVHVLLHKFGGGYFLP